MVSQGRPELV